MSDRNSLDYLNLDNFDESIDSRDYRRRRPDNRSSSYKAGSSYNKRRPNRRRRHRRRTRNRIIIVTSGLLILVLFITMIAAIVNGCGKKTEPTVMSTETKPPVTATEAPTLPSQPSTTPATTAPAPSGDKLSTTVFNPPQIEDNGATGYDGGAIYVWNGAGFELFGGSEGSGQAYAETINDLAGKVPGVNVYSMVVPNHTEMGLPDRDFKSDHHWTGLGAYYAYTAFADTLGIPALSLDDCTEQTIDGFTGSFSSMATLDTDTVSYWQFPYNVTMDITEEDGNQVHFDSPYYEAEESGPNSYGVFVYGDNPITLLQSSSPNAQQGKRIAVIKESYGNAFVAYLTNNYEEVHVLDMRSFRKASTDNLATYCQNNGITDLLFINGIMSANNQTLLDSTVAMFE